MRNLGKRYGRTVALDGLDLEVAPGEFFGLLGPNGAGKTTAIRVLTTLARPDSGQASVGGHDVAGEPVAAKRLIGVVPQQYNLDNDLSGWENLDVHGRLWGLDRRSRRTRAAEMLARVDLEAAAPRPVRQYSGGMKRRLMIARALMHRPEVLILDEPTIGLDVAGRRGLWALLKALNADGRTILLTTHYIEEAEELCQRVGIIHQGRLIALDEPSRLIATAGQVVVDVFEDGEMTSRFFPDRVAAGRFAAGIGAPAHIRPANLEDVFVRLTGRRVDR